VKLALLVVVLGACDVVAGLDEVPTADLAPGCSGTRLLARGFGDGALDPLWMQAVPAGVTVTTSGGDLEISTTTATRTTIYASAGLDLRDDAVSVGVVAGDLSNVQLELDLYAPISPNALLMYINGGTLQFLYNDGTGAITMVGTLRYDPVAHRYLRIAQLGGETRWDTSADGKTWDVRATAKLDWVAYVDPQIALTSPTAPFDVTLDHLDIGAASGVVCRAAGLADDFNAPAFDRRWVPGHSNGAIDIEDGQVVATVNGGGASGVGELASATIYDVDNSSLAVHVVEMPDIATDANVVFTLGLLGLDSVIFLESAGTIHANVGTLGSFGSIAWDPATTSWWRFRGEHGVLHWEVSGDGRTYTEIAQAPGLAIDRASVAFYLQGNDPNTAIFDSFNAPP
jgi:hypothetical protein